VRSLGVHEAVQPREGLAEDLFVQEQEGAQRLIMGRGADLGIDGQGRKEPGDLRLTHLGWMADAVEEDEPLDPSYVRLLGPPAVVPRADRFTYAIKELGLWLGQGLGHFVLAYPPLPLPHPMGMRLSESSSCSRWYSWPSFPVERPF